jgi:hypothetical protein
VQNTENMDLREFRAKIIDKNGNHYFLSVTANTAREALDIVATNLPDDSYRQISVPDLSGLQKFTEWLKTINARF